MPEAEGGGTTPPMLMWGICKSKLEREGDPRARRENISDLTQNQKREHTTNQKYHASYLVSEGGDEGLNCLSS